MRDLVLKAVRTFGGNTTEKTAIVNRKGDFVHNGLVMWKVCKYTLFLALFSGCALLADCDPQRMSQRPGSTSGQKVTYDGPDNPSFVHDLESAGYSGVTPEQAPSGSDGWLRKLTRQGLNSPALQKRQLSGGAGSPQKPGWHEKCPSLDAFLNVRKWARGTQKAIDFVRKNTLRGMIKLDQGLEEMIGKQTQESSGNTSGGWTTRLTGAINKFGSSNFHQDNLDAHNEYRAKHGVSPLRLNGELSQISQRWAEYLASLGSTDKIRHSDEEWSDDYGENIHASSGYLETGRTAVDSWYSEIKDYNFQTGRSINGNKIGHLTQLLWKDSKELGVGYAFSSDGSIFVVCHYNPAGNYVGQNTMKVPPIGGFS